MNRRGFLAMLAGAVLDPERLLWVPGKKLISIPAESAPWPWRHGPFLVTAHMEGSSDVAAIMERLLNHRWTMDPVWRQHAQDMIDRDMQRILLGEVQQTIGFFRTSEKPTPSLQMSA
jgi:hypothetical protein